jgi:hypothetical protein
MVPKEASGMSDNVRKTPGGKGGADNLPMRACCKTAASDDTAAVSDSAASGRQKQSSGRCQPLRLTKP